MAADAGPAVSGETGLFDVFGYGGLLPVSCSCCASSPRWPGMARHEPSSTIARRVDPRGPAAALDERAPGERYYRHPGDVVRLVLWGVATVAVGLLTQFAEGDQRRAA